MPRRRPNGAQARADRMVEVLREVLPRPIVELEHTDPWQLLVATILSAQSTDAMVNKVTPRLFERWPTPAALATADPDEVKDVVRPTGYFNQKTKHLLGAARGITERFEGEVPDTMEALTSLPGVGRKTAGVVLGTIWGKPEGITVDTHCWRMARRLQLTAAKNGQDNVERDLMRGIPRAEWIDTGHRMVLYGRYVCTARKPSCEMCPLNEACPSAEKEADGDHIERVSRARLHIVAESPFQVLDDL